MSLPSISFAFFVDDSMAAIRDACSLQLFSSSPLYSTWICTGNLGQMSATQSVNTAESAMTYCCQLELRQVLHKLRTVWPLKLICVKVPAGSKVCLKCLRICEELG